MGEIYNYPFREKPQIIQTYIQLYTTQKFNTNQKRSA